MRRCGAAGPGPPGPRPPLPPAGGVPLRPPGAPRRVALGPGHCPGVSTEEGECPERDWAFAGGGALDGMRDKVTRFLSSAADRLVPLSSAGKSHARPFPKVRNGPMPPPPMNANACLTGGGRTTNPRIRLVAPCVLPWSPGVRGVGQLSPHCRRGMRTARSCGGCGGSCSGRWWCRSPRRTTT
jgi:hypothetical protein